jgi:hypothetical protein
MAARTARKCLRRLQGQFYTRAPVMDRGPIR